MEVLKQISQVLSGVLGSFFISDMDVMSDEAKRIFANENDRKIYIEAVEKLKNAPGKEEKITLSTDETITLVS